MSEQEDRKAHILGVMACLSAWRVTACSHHIAGSSVKYISLNATLSTTKYREWYCCSIPYNEMTDRAVLYML